MMKKIPLTQVFNTNNYYAPQFSSEKKAYIFSRTTRKRTSFFFKKKYFVEIALSLFLVFVIGINLDYFQHLGKPLEIDYQALLEKDL
ncbi:MAG: hypothetical protein GXP45_00800 [bacterium]|nr:hypothetical protein [bacterium]